ncbi:MAG: class I SAM-dependent methyltransferase [Sulfitobacter sp.]
MPVDYLNQVYETTDPDDLRTLYDNWSASYETDVTESGYATPKRCAEALAQFAPDKSQPVLDFGCGTGLVGLALEHAGFSIIDGVDTSPNMLVQAGTKNLYRSLTKIHPDEPKIGHYNLISAVGLIGSDAAPMSTLYTLMEALPKEGKLVFSLNDHALAEPENIGRLNEWLDCGAAHLLFSEHGEHLPKIDLQSTVYVVGKP